MAQSVPVTAMLDILAVGIAKARAKMGPPTLRYCAYIFCEGPAGSVYDFL